MSAPIYASKQESRLTKALELFILMPGSTCLSPNYRRSVLHLANVFEWFGYPINMHRAFTTRVKTWKHYNRSHTS